LIQLIEKSYTDYCFAIRGFKIHKTITYMHPMYWFLKHILDEPNPEKNPFIIPNKGIYYKNQLVKLAACRKSLVYIPSKRRYICTLDPKNPDLMPGDSYLKKLEFRFWNTHSFINTSKNFNTLNNRSKSVVKKSKKQGFEKHLKHGMKYIITKMQYDLYNQ
jgi:hypothetical protein